MRATSLAFRMVLACKKVCAINKITGKLLDGMGSSPGQKVLLIMSFSVLKHVFHLGDCIPLFKGDYLKNLIAV